MDFLKRWESRKEFSKSKTPLKPQLEEAIRIVTMQIQRLDIKSARIKEHDRSLFEQVVHFYTKRDLARAKMYANELRGKEACEDDNNNKIGFGTDISKTRNREGVWRRRCKCSSRIAGNQ